MCREGGSSAHRGCIVAGAGAALRTGRQGGPARAAGTAGRQRWAGADRSHRAPARAAGGLLDVLRPAKRPLVARPRERHAAVQALRAAGHIRPALARILDLARTPCTGSRPSPASTSCWSRPPAGTASLDPFKPCLTRRQNEGVTSAAALHDEMAAAPGWEAASGPSSATSPVPPRRRPDQPGQRPPRSARHGHPQDPPGHPLDHDPPRSPGHSAGRPGPPPSRRLPAPERPGRPHPQPSPR